MSRLEATVTIITSCCVAYALCVMGVPVWVVIWLVLMALVYIKRNYN